MNCRILERAQVSERADNVNMEKEEGASLTPI